MRGPRPPVGEDVGDPFGDRQVSYTTSAARVAAVCFATCHVDERGPEASSWRRLAQLGPQRHYRGLRRAHSSFPGRHRRPHSTCLGGRLGPDSIRPRRSSTQATGVTLHALRGGGQHLELQRCGRRGADARPGDLLGPPLSLSLSLYPDHRLDLFIRSRLKLSK